MSPHLMKSLDDLDLFSNEQIELTRAMDAEKDGARRFLRSAIDALSQIHTAMAVVSLPHFQRAAYEADRAHRRTGDRSDQIAAQTMWRMVLYMQEVWEGMVANMKDPEVRAAAERMGQKLGIDFLGMFDRSQEE